MSANSLVTVEDLLESQRLLMRQLRRAQGLVDGTVCFISEMSDEEMRAIVDSAVMEGLLCAQEHLRKAEDALLAGVQRSG
jgi:hypothetical protein